MKVCTRYLDYMEKHDVACDSPEWLDLIAHAGKCPDCSLAMQQRGAMLEALENLSPPAYPVDLHQRIVSEVAAASTSGEETVAWYDGLFDRFLRPLEVGFSLACIMMVALMLNSESETLPVHDNTRLAALPASDVKVEPAGNHDELDPVSPEEVKEFLARLERFNQQHPGQHEVRTDDYMPELRLVNDWK